MIYQISITAHVGSRQVARVVMAEIMQPRGVDRYPQASHVRQVLVNEMLRDGTDPGNMVKSIKLLHPNVLLVFGTEITILP